MFKGVDFMIDNRKDLIPGLGDSSMIPVAELLAYSVVGAISESKLEEFDEVIPHC
jgi:hypothetical protein